MALVRVGTRNRRMKSRLEDRKNRIHMNKGVVAVAEGDHS
jgi:hypothetical protein